MVATFLAILTPVFVAVDPLPVAPIFAALTAGRTAIDKRRMAKRAAIAGASILMFFAALGPTLLQALHLHLAAFRAAGGLLLLLTAIDMLRAKISFCRCSARELQEGEAKRYVSIMPIATPMLAGPAAIAIVMMLMTEYLGIPNKLMMLAAIAITFGVAYVALRFAPVVAAMLGESGIAMVQRVMGLFLAAQPTQLILQGIAALWGEPT